MERTTKTLRRRVNKARRFPVNTCGASRHVRMIADALAEGETYHMLAEEPEHCAQSLYAAVASLWEARTEIEALRRKYEPEQLEADYVAAVDRFSKAMRARRRTEDVTQPGASPAREGEWPSGQKPTEPNPPHQRSRPWLRPS